MDKPHREVIYFNPTGSAELHLSQMHQWIQKAGWTLHTASDPGSALRLIEKRHPLVGIVQFDPSADPHIPDWMKHLVQTGHGMEWVALLPKPCLEKAEVRRVIGECFYDYHTLPCDQERLLVTLGHAYGMMQIKGSDRFAPESSTDEHEMVGTSPIMLALFRNLRKVASVDASVLITGESGTGKELAARAIHERSIRAQGPFVAINCGALPANLIQSELFGYEKGAFTGAHQRKIGYIEKANKGTLFLDEIGDLPLELQVNLLRFLQERTIERVGGTERIHLDVRVIAATHIDLEQAVEQGRFREDLYYRLNVLHLRMPALRERGEDIELLARFFFTKFAAEKRRHVQGFSQQALAVLRDYHWPGNVRELINRVRRAMVMCEHRLITPIDLGLTTPSPGLRLVTLDEARSLAEKSAIQTTLRLTGNNVSQAARRLGVSRRQLYRLLEKYGLVNEAD